MKQKKNGFRKGKKRNMKRALCLTAAVLLVISMMGCDTNPSSSATAGVTETKDTVTAGVTETNKPLINTDSPWKPTSPEERNPALDEFVEKCLKYEPWGEGERIAADISDLFNKIGVSDANKALENIPVRTIKEGSLLTGLGRSVGAFERTSGIKYENGLAIYIWRLYPTAVRTSGDRAYFVFEVEDGARYYAFCDKAVNDYYCTAGYPILMNKVRDKKDFEGLKIGDSIKKVQQIEPLAEYYAQSFKGAWDTDYNYATVDSTRGVVSQVGSIHYVKDGLVIIRYIPTEDNGDMIISSIENIEGYVYKDDFGREINCEINPLDLPQ